MIWWAEGLAGHFQTSVIDPALRALVGRVEGGAGEEDEEEGEGGGRGQGLGRHGHGRNRSATTVGSETTRPGSPTTAGEGNGAERDRFGGGGGETLHAGPAPPAGGKEDVRRPLDFTALTTLHALYLSVLLSGLLLNSDALTEAVRALMETCERFCGKVERWGGDILPGLLDGGLDEEESALRE